MLLNSTEFTDHWAEIGRPLPPKGHNMQSPLLYSQGRVTTQGMGQLPSGMGGSPDPNFTGYLQAHVQHEEATETAPSTHKSGGILPLGVPIPARGQERWRLLLLEGSNGAPQSVFILGHCSNSGPGLAAGRSPSLLRTDPKGEEGWH